MVKQPAWTRPVTGPYSMRQVRARKATNGLTLAGSFSGCGGSSIGYQLAGFDVRYACEFDQHAADSYTAAFPATFMDRRSIADVKGADVIEAAGGPIDVWEGSPPCSKFSTAGKRSKAWNKVTKADQAHELANVEDLVHQWTRLLGEIRPRAAVAENVMGMTTGPPKGQLIRAMNTIIDFGYECRVWKLDASSFGVPQVRRRIFIVCWDPKRCDTPQIPERIGEPVTAREAFADLDTQPVTEGTTKINVVDNPDHAPLLAETSSTYRRLSILDVGQKHLQRFSLGRSHPDRPWPTIGAIETTTTSLPAPFHWDWPPRKLSRRELERAQTFPHDYPWPADTTLQHFGLRIGNSVPPFLAAAVGRSLATALRST